ncbi:aminoglycoside phosphotransferase family protein [Bariatricus sp. SGI.154]|uniref:aminoglycoside phosphotransferase family protein n=1 Tax=Bariatricus sp. SGI.154 TaxID=3420549 RepID=UPI003CFEE420
MDRIAGLQKYVKNQKYREALGLPREVSEEYRMLAQGEYNINYLFTHPVSGQRLLLRVNCGSQMHLENQIGYEYHALKLLEDSGRTPKALYVDGSLELLDHGVMVMEFLPGNVLDYRTDLDYAAACLADIHSVKLDGPSGLFCPENPLKAVLEECEEMVKTYMESSLGREETKAKIRRMLDAGWEMIQKIPVEDTYHCCINTELNSTNFLINGKGGPNYLIDWEKPLYGDPAQDIGHFLAPTTTFWKTDVILAREEMDAFIDTYIRAVDGRFDTEGLRDRIHIYIPITCLRGVTWCAMAWVQYQQPDKLIFNESTYRKLEAYLSDEFLDALVM